MAGLHFVSLGNTPKSLQCINTPDHQNHDRNVCCNRQEGKTGCIKEDWKKMNTSILFTLHYCHHTDEWVLLPLLGGGSAGADERHDDDDHHGDRSHRNHDDDQQVAILLRRGAAMGWSHLTNGILWKTQKSGGEKICNTEFPLNW